MGTIRFSRDDLELFSRASHDRSRLHMSDEYARQTIYGEAIVFGILGAFASLEALSDRPGLRLAGALLEYRAPFYMGVDYRTECDESGPGKARVLLKDGARTLMSARFSFREAPDADRATEVPGIAPLDEQADWRPQELMAGLSVSGRYAPEPGAFRALLRRWRVDIKGVTIPQVAVFLWSSYLTGMQMPGLPGTSARLRLDYRTTGPGAEIPFDYEARVVEFDERFSLLRTGASLEGAGGAFVDAEVSSHVRGAQPPSA